MLALVFIGSAMAGVKVGENFPPVGSYALEPKPPEDLKGKVVLIDFWASWCEPCRESFPVMDALQKKYADKGFVILAVNVDEERKDMEEFLKKNKPSFTVVRDAKQKLVEKVEVGTMPSSFLIDREGKVRFMHSGFKGEETRKKYQEEIESLLK